MVGRVLNTHQQWLCRQLADRGYVVTRQIAVPDTASDIEQAVRESLSRADLVITTGGLGPTSDDITRELIAKLLGKELHRDEKVMAHIEDFFALRKRKMPEVTKVQALVPEGAQVLWNPNGTAPGLAMKIAQNPFRADKASSWLIMLPGPPRELRPMFLETVVPLLAREMSLTAQFVCRTLRTTGIGESLVQDRIQPLLASVVHRGLDLAYCAHSGAVDVRLSAVGPHAELLVAEGESIVKESLGSFVYGNDDENLDALVVRLLTEKKLTLATAESCTGGGIAHRITNIPGASAVFLAGLVTYSNEAKQKFLGVHAETLAKHGAVSEEVAREMAHGARLRSNADYTLSVTGIAGPTGATEGKPVGTVFIGLASADGVLVKREFNPYERETFKQVTGQQALEMLRRKLLA